MSLGLLMDVHVQSAITAGLRSRGVDVVTAQECGFDRLDDPEFLDEALRLARVVFPRDDDFLKIVAGRQRARIDFSTVVYAHQMRVSVGQCIRDLEILAKASAAEDVRNRIYHLPLP